MTTITILIIITATITNAITTINSPSSSSTGLDSSHEQYYYTSGSLGTSLTFKYRVLLHANIIENLGA
jgi:hypothetical protein